MGALRELLGAPSARVLLTSHPVSRWFPQASTAQGPLLFSSLPAPPFSWSQTVLAPCELRAWPCSPSVSVLLLLIQHDLKG